MPNKKPPTKAATIVKNPPIKTTAIAKKPPTKATAIAKKPPTKAAAIARKPPTQALAVAKKPLTQAMIIALNRHTQALIMAKNPSTKAMIVTKNPPNKATQIVKNQLPSRRQIASEVLLLFNVYVKEALIKAIDQDNALIFIEDEDVIKVHAFTDRPAHFQFVLPDLRSLIRIPGLIDPNNPANLIASFERKDKLRDITLELIGATYNEEKKLTTLRVRRVPGAETFDSVKLEIGEKVKVKDLRLCIDDVPAPGQQTQIINESTSGPITIDRNTFALIGGAGGGGGAAPFSGGDSGGGGGGGGAAAVIGVLMPGTQLTNISLGVGGRGGETSPGNLLNGGDGTETRVTITTPPPFSSSFTYVVPGGRGGRGGQGENAGLGGAGGALPTVITGNVARTGANGGSGGQSGDDFSIPNLGIFFTGGQGGLPTDQEVGIGGGGGGGGAGANGNGGHGGGIGPGGFPLADNGDPAPPNSGAGGGGGGGFTGFMNGGNGDNGFILFLSFDTP